VRAECKILTCERPVESHGYCQLHSERLKHGRDLNAPVRFRKPNDPTVWSDWKVRKPTGYVIRQRGGGRYPNEYQLQHRVVMEDKLGRALLPGENVHHINGVKHDNRPENLELWVTTQPSGQRVSDLLAWAHGIIDLYEIEGLD
jgi:hypothetical protein